MTLLQVIPERKGRRLKHTAVFNHESTTDSPEPELEIIAIDDIYAINYEIPKVVTP